MPFISAAQKWLAVGLLGGGLALALWVQTTRLNAAQAEHAAAIQVATQWRTNFEAMAATNAANVRAIEKLQAEAARIEYEANVARTNKADISKQYELLRRTLRHAPEPQAVSLSPVLCRTFNELRRIDGQDGTACSD